MVRFVGSKYIFITVFIALAFLAFAGGAEGACLSPTGGEVISTSTVICPGTHQLSAGITVGSNDITIECDNSIIKGTGAGNLIMVSTDTNVTIKNCVLSNASYGIDTSAAQSNYFINNTMTDFGI